MSAFIGGTIRIGVSANIVGNGRPLPLVSTARRLAQTG